MKKNIYIQLFCFLLLFISACKKEVPEAKVIFIGDWYCTSPVATLSITNGSKAHYYSQTNDVEIDGTIKFESYGFKIRSSSNPFGKRKFIVSVEPTFQMSNGGYYMVVDDKLFLKK